MIRTWFFLLALGTADDGAFTRARQSAEPLSSLGNFLEKYIGECSGAIGPDCKSHAAAFRTKSNGQSFIVTLSDEAVTMLAPGKYEPARKDFEIRVTPFFGAAGYALTQGSPKKTDAQGNPILPLVMVHANLGDRWTPERFQRLLSNHELRVEVLFQPQTVWTFAKKTGGKSYGVAARLEGIRIVESRSGDPVAIWLPR